MPVSEEARKDFNESIRPIKEQINGLIKKDKDESFALRNQKEGVELKKIMMATLLSLMVILLKKRNPRIPTSPFFVPTISKSHSTNLSFMLKRLVN